MTRYSEVLILGLQLLSSLSLSLKDNLFLSQQIFLKPTDLLLKLLLKKVKLNQPKVLKEVLPLLLLENNKLQHLKENQLKVLPLSLQSLPKLLNPLDQLPLPPNLLQLLEQALPSLNHLLDLQLLLLQRDQTNRNS